MPPRQRAPRGGAPPRPRVITIAAQKGGCSKTTLAVHLAVHAALRGRSALLIDLDPQQSASKWYDRREAEEPALVTATAGGLADVLEAAASDHRAWVIVDTPPHAGAQIDIAVQAADLVLIPCKPTPMDLDALPDTVEIIRRHQRPAGFVLTSTPARAKIVMEARQQLQEEYPDIPVLDAELGHRTAFYYALIDGRAVSEFEPSSKATHEIAAIYTWCDTHLNQRGMP